MTGILRNRRKESVPLGEGVTLALMVGQIFLFLLAWMDPEAAWNIGTFDRVVGAAALWDVSVDKRITGMYLISFGMVLIAVILWFLAVYFKPRGKCTRQQYEMASLWAVCGICRLGMQFASGNAPALENSMVELMVLAGTVFQMVLLLWDIPDEGWAGLLSLAGFGVVPLFWAFTASIGGNDLSLLAPVIYLAVVAAGMTLLKKKKKLFLRAADSLWPLAWGMAGLSILYEVRILLAQRGTLIYIRGRSVLIYGAVLALACGVAWLLGRRRELPSLEKMEKRYILPILLGLALLCGQMPVSFETSTELFESANAGMAVHEFFQYGSLPILENFDAHMLRSFLSNALYQALSGDWLGALWYGYSVIPLVAVAFYLLLRLFVPVQAAAVMVVLFPWQGDLSLTEYYGVGLLVSLLFYHVLKKDGIGWHLLLWLSCGALVLYLLDVGVAFSLGIGGAMLVALVVRRQWNRLARTICGGLTGLGIVLGGLAALCLAKGIPVTLRIREFLNAALSNEQWGGSILGEYGAGYALAYLVLPAVMVLLILWVMLVWKANGCRDNKAVLLLSLFFAYGINYTRALVRHSVAESYNNGYPLTGTALLFIALAIHYCITERKGWAVPAGTAARYCAALFLFTLLGGGTFTWEDTLADGMHDPQWFLDYSADLTTIRCAMTKEVDAIYAPLKLFFDATLEPDQTYVDFTGDTLLYALTDRKKPMYVNQSPALVNGEWGQQAFIDQCQQADAVYLLLKSDFEEEYLDSISYYQRYYLIGEYLNQNYTPLCRIVDYEIWCRNDMLQTQQEKIDGLTGLAQATMDPLEEEELHLHKLVWLPLVWGEKDTLEPQPVALLQESASLSEKDKLTLPLTVDAEDKEQGNYLLFTMTYEDSEQENMSVYLMNDGQDLCEFQFRIKEGTHQYKIRISGDPAWYQPGVDEIRFDLWQNTGEIQEIQLCRGDSLAEGYEN